MRTIKNLRAMAVLAGCVLVLGAEAFGQSGGGITIGGGFGRGSRRGGLQGGISFGSGGINIGFGAQTRGGAQFGGVVAPRGQSGVTVDAHGRRRAVQAGVTFQVPQNSCGQPYPAQPTHGHTQVYGQTHYQGQPQYHGQAQVLGQTQSRGSQGQMFGGGFTATPVAPATPTPVTPEATPVTPETTPETPDFPETSPVTPDTTPEIPETTPVSPEVTSEIPDAPAVELSEELPPPAVEVEEPTPAVSDADAMMALVNQERTTAGLAPFTLEQQLTAAAEKHAADMVAQGKLTHTGSDGSTVGSRVTAEGYTFRAAGENVAKAGSADQAFQAWMGSAAHRAALLNGEFQDVGVARSGNHWVLVFGVRK